VAAENVAQVGMRLIDTGTINITGKVAFQEKIPNA